VHTTTCRKVGGGMKKQPKYTRCLSGHHHNFLLRTAWHLQETPATHSGIHKEKVRESRRREPERGGMGNIMLKGNEELL